jgi:hypothetical protein
MLATPPINNIQRGFLVAMLPDELRTLIQTRWTFPSFDHQRGSTENFPFMQTKLGAG